jgi:predicted TPR repeat methyltransferase
MLQNSSQPTPATPAKTPTDVQPYIGAVEKVSSIELHRSWSDAVLIASLFSRTHSGLFDVTDRRRVRLAQSFVAAALRELEHGLAVKAPEIVDAPHIAPGLAYDGAGPVVS